jgi:hypothetical protein
MEIPMKRTILIMIFCLSLVQSFLIPTGVSAQNAPVKCGDVIKGDLAKANQMIGYPILLSPGYKLTISGQADGTSQLIFGVVLDGPAGKRVFPHEDVDVTLSATPFLVTGRMAAYGIHTIYVFNKDKTGAFQIGISCELPNGDIVPVGASKTAPQPTGKPKTITLPIATILGNSLRQLQCGNVIASEFSQNEQVHAFSLEMVPGDLSFQIALQPFGDALYVSGAVLDPSSKVVASTWNLYTAPNAQFNVTPVTQGNYRIFVSNHAITDNGAVRYAGNKNYMGGLGIYTLTVSCLLKGNKLVAPDPSKLDQPTTANASDSPSASATSIDISKLIKIPLIASTPMSGAVTSTGSEVYGYTLDAKANAVLNLNFTRIQGNLNLGLAVLAADGKTLLYQSNLFGTQTTSVQITIPTDGQYFVVVYRTDPVPDKSEATAFTVQADVK